MYGVRLAGIALALVALSGCVSDLAVVGSYSNAEYGTIILGDDGNGTWREPQGDVHIARWSSSDSSLVTFTTEDGETYDGVVGNGVLLLDPHQGLGDETVPFTLIVQQDRP